MKTFEDGLSAVNKPSKRGVGWFPGLTPFDVIHGTMTHPNNSTLLIARTSHPQISHSKNDETKKRNGIGGNSLLRLTS